VHIHAYCSFVDTTGVPCRTTPGLANPLTTATTPDPSGYTVAFNSYTVEEQTTLLRAARQLFEANGLGTPTSFRAGGWAADAGTMTALEQAGYALESSSVTVARLEEWRGRVLFQYLSMLWPGITETSQPYYPSQANAAVAGAGPRVLQVPDNGALVDYVTGQEMIDILRMNWSGEPLPAPKVFQIGFHPPNFSLGYLGRMETVLPVVDAALHADDKGPIVYVALSKLTKVFTQ
jgi:hypothetical protein